MFDWQVTKERETWDGLSGEEEAPHRRRLGRWSLLLVVLVVLGAAGAAMLRQRVGEQWETMRADLQDAIEDEERARLFGLRDEVGRLLAPSVSEEWEQAYRRTFDDAVKARPIAVEVLAVELDEAGERALVEVRVDEQAQLRHYHLYRGQWRRAPLPELAGLWGAPAVTRSRDGVLIRYRERDEAFAEHLAAELPALLDAVRRWNPRLAPRTIDIVPQELGPAVEVEERERVALFVPPREAVAEAGGSASRTNPVGELAEQKLDPTVVTPDLQITLNSPLLAPTLVGVDGASAVRYALAEQLWNRVSVSGPQRISPPTTRLMLAAARDVAAYQWAMSDESQERVRARWREQVPAEWRSPLYSVIPDHTQATLLDPGPERVGMWLLVDYLHRTEGETAIGEIIEQITEGAESWDEIFHAAAGRTTYVVEQEVMAYAREGLAAAERVRVSAEPPKLTFPLRA
ncbi:MAG: hypothetical protein M3220_00880 [Chloroflexota bacterium]|nr:hypothetical protein [Chloroflexota bacterium]